MKMTFFMSTLFMCGLHVSFACASQEPIISADNATHILDGSFWAKVLANEAWIIEHNGKCHGTESRPSRHKDITKSFLRSLLDQQPGLVLTYPGLDTYFRSITG